MSHDDDFPINNRRGFFDLDRVHAGPSQFPQIFRPVTDDVLFFGWVFCLLVIFISLIVTLPAYRFTQGLKAFLRMLLAMAVLSSIMICNFGQDWEVAEIKNVTTAYRAALNREIHANIGVHIGLRSVNVTLLGRPRVQVFEGGRVNETINYNERISWDNEGFVQGRNGFGSRATQINLQFREMQRRGAPYPILWVMEYLTVDGEGLRWGRHYRQAGYYAYITIWFSATLWMVGLILFQMVLRFGGLFSVLTGTSLLLSNIIFACYRNANKLEIPFSEASLVFKWGWCFWLCLATGVFTILMGLVVVIMDIVAPERLTDFFDFDITKDFEEFYVEPEELMREKSRKSYRTKTIFIPKPGEDQNQQEGIYQRGFRKRTVAGVAQKSFKNKPRTRDPASELVIGGRKSQPSQGAENGVKLEEIREVEDDCDNIYVN